MVPPALKGTGKPTGETEHSLHSKPVSFCELSVSTTCDYICALRVFCCSFVFLNLAQARVLWEEETSVEKMLSPDWPVGKSVTHFLD